MLLWCILWSGCARPTETDPEPTPGTTPPETSTPTSTSTATGDTATATATGDTAAPLDCSVRPQATVVRHHDYVPTAEDFTFDDEGYLWGVSTATSGLIRIPLDGAPELMLPNVSSWGRGTRFLPGGDLVVAEPDRGALIRVDRATMGVTTVRSGLSSPNGVAIDDDGMVFLTQASGRVVRIDPDAGTEQLVYATPLSTDGVTLAPDYERLYWDSESGEVITAVVDAEGTVTSGPEVLTTIATGAGILDGMTADACGNLYVVKMNGTVVRVLPDGTQETLVTLSSHPAGGFICAVNFGSGVGGWERDHLYVMSLQEGLFEVDVGIEGKWEPHYPVGG
ncbi:MAG: SMP-30/gluconolactonase/LRE family protein [Myxococcota bacterium]